MTKKISADLIVVGAGPAGMAAARRAVAGGLAVIVLDSQPQPGGQIWRNVSRNAQSPILKVLGGEYQRGVERVQAFLDCGATYIPDAHVSRITDGWTVEFVRNGEIHTAQGENLLLATGAQERPVPFAGWTLPGVMTVGAAQILLKTAGQLPKGPIIVAGNGPLPLLYLQQMRLAGAKPVAFLDTTPRGLFTRAVRNLAGAFREPRQVLKGIAWLPALTGIKQVRNVVGIAATGDGRLEAVDFRFAGGQGGRLEARTLLIHEGLVPGHHLAVSAGAQLVWDESQFAFMLERDDWMNAGRDGLYLAGDGARIGGAENAEIEGEIAAIGILQNTSHLAPQRADNEAAPLRARLGRLKAFRRFLDEIYPPKIARSAPQDETTICRCEELNAGDLRQAIQRGGCKGPNQLKSFTRAGMGPCQGRQCGYPVHEMIKTAAGLSADSVGLYKPRPPFVPVTVSMLAAQETEAVEMASHHE